MLHIVIKYHFRKPEETTIVFGQVLKSSPVQNKRSTSCKRPVVLMIGENAHKYITLYVLCFNVKSLATSSLGQKNAKARVGGHKLILASRFQIEKRTTLSP